MLEIHERNVNWIGKWVTEILDFFLLPNFTLFKFKHQVRQYCSGFIMQVIPFTYTHSFKKIVRI